MSEQSSKAKEESSNLSKIDFEKLENLGGTLWEGWVKYFRYRNGSGQDKPTNFFLNSQYYKQRVTKDKRFKKDTKGFLFIPSQFHFYANLLHDNFNILYSREKDTTMTADTMLLDLIFPIKKDKIFKSSIKDLGNFNEGNCILVLTKIPNNPDVKFEANESSSDGVGYNWIICLDDPKEKEKLFTILIRYKLNLQEAKEDSLEQKGAAERNNPPNLSQALNPKQAKSIERYEGEGASKKDGYLMLLNDWTQCTLKCGGGFSYQQWMCVPPKEGGRPCSKNLIRKRECNTQPCPGSLMDNSVKTTKGGVENLQVVEKPIIKSLPFSTKPQQFVKCLIRENDVLVGIEGENIAKNTKLPARLVLNQRSLSLYKDDKYENAIFNFKLDLTVINPNSNDHCCFYVSSEIKKFNICAFDSECGTITNPKFVNDWIYSLNLFKTRCFDHLRVEKAGKSVGLTTSTPAELDALAQAMSVPLATAETKEKFIKKKLEESAEQNLEKKIEQTQEVALKAIKKELNIEELIKRELSVKSKQEADELLVEMKNEEKKKQQLENVFKEREAEDQKTRNVKQAQLQMELIKRQAKNEIAKKRASLANKIKELKQKSARRKHIIEEQITMIRGQIANQIIKSQKKGEIKKCRDGMTDQQKIEYYCNTNIIEDFNKNAECKITESFCYICCENEFGTMFIENRDECYAMCDKEIKAELEKTGTFRWAK